MRFSTLILTLLSFCSLGQVDNRKLVDSLKFVNDMPYLCETGDGFGCGDKIFWHIVQQKQTIVPVLIDMLTDTTKTAATVPNFGGHWTVGDIAYNGLQEIIKSIPTFDLLGVKFDDKDCGYCAYWSYLRKDMLNRKRFQERVRKWYDNNKANLVWVISNAFMTCDCSGKHPNGGHFELRR